MVARQLHKCFRAHDVDGRNALTRLQLTALLATLLGGATGGESAYIGVVGHYIVIGGNYVVMIICNRWSSHCDWWQLHCDWW
jgi:hypothetical protein